jgi:nucleoside-diphosphate-sugar epimerase
MNILITSAAAPLAQTLATALQPEHAVRLTERRFVPNLANFAQCTLDPDLATEMLVRDMGAIVHVAEPLPTDSAQQQIDYLTRCTYNLCLAAATAGVERLVYLSTLQLMTQYDETYAVSERWRPSPTTQAPVLAKHLGEFVCREFAREHKLKVTILRLGQVVYGEGTVGQPLDPTWVHVLDVAQAVHRALTTATNRWTVCHIQHESAQARFSVGTAKRVLGYAPVHTVVTP